MLYWEGMYKHGVRGLWQLDPEMDLDDLDLEENPALAEFVEMTNGCHVQVQADRRLPWGQARAEEGLALMEQAMMHGWSTDMLERWFNGLQALEWVLQEMQE